jgi:sugar phosphate isomerase/epimerase
MTNTNGVDRRTFLAACAVLLQAGSLRAARTSKMKFALTTYEWGVDWDIPTLIDNCSKAHAFGVEVRTDQQNKHGIELTLTKAQRSDVKKRFADSPVKLLTVNCGERYDYVDPAAAKAAVEKSKAYVLLAQDVGAGGIRVFPNDFHKEVPEERTIAQIAECLNAVGRFAKDHNQIIRLENHGSAGRLTDLRKILDRVDQKNVRIKLNGDKRDNAANDFAQNFALVKDRLDNTLHMRLYRDTEFPYQLQFDLLVDMGWDGWCVVEESIKVPDRVQALIEENQMWEKLIANSLKRA